MKSFLQYISEDNKAIQHHGHMYAVYHTRNRMNPQLAARQERNKHLEHLKRYGVTTAKEGGVAHPDPESRRALGLGLAQGMDSEHNAQPEYRKRNLKSASKIRSETTPFTGLAAFRNIMMGRSKPKDKAE